MAESRTRTFSTRRARWVLTGAAALVLTTGALSSCRSDGAPEAAADTPSTSSSSAAPAVSPVRLDANVRFGATDVPVDQTVEVSTRHGSLTSVRLESPGGEVAGELARETNTWRASDRLEPGTNYVVRAVAEREDGARVTRTRRFHTQDLTLAQQTYASIAPLQGETVGVGMPVIVTFDVPVTDRASIEKHMSVRATPKQPGTWHWLNDQEVHWRPKAYWQAGSEVNVDLDINSIAAGAGVYGQENRHVDFRIGDANVYKVDARSHQMQVYSNGTLLRTLPITTGKPGFTTRSGVKVIIEKFDVKRMNSETVGISESSPEYYDIDDVRWAMRVTYSGEFVHAAPWSVGSQGHDNVSHGCTGLSTENAAWLYAMSKRGDVVEYTGTDRPMTLDNGYGDWNASFADYRTGSALS